MPLTTFRLIPYRVDYNIAADTALVAVVLAALYVFYVPAERRATGSWWRGVRLVPAVVALHVGLSTCCAISFIAGLVSRRTAFVRTPKRAAAGDGPRYRSAASPYAIVEVAIGLAYLTFAALAIRHRLAPAAAVFALWAAAHLWTGTATLRR
jgi:hypothetical protein